MSKSTYIELINVIPKGISESIEFWIRTSKKHFEKIEVACGERIQFKTNSKSGAWHVYVVINGLKTKTYSSIFPNNSYICQIDHWVDEIFSRKIKESDIEIIVSQHSANSAISRINEIISLKRLDLFKEVSEVLLSQHQQGDNNAVQPLIHAVKSLSRSMFDEFVLQDVLKNNIVSEMLNELERLNLEEKMFFLLQLKPQIVPEGKSQYALWSKTTAKTCEFWLNVLGQIDNEIENDFDFELLPEINSSRDNDKIDKDNNERVKKYNKQFYLSRSRIKLFEGMTKYFTLIPKAFQLSTPLEEKNKTLSDEAIKKLKNNKPKVIPKDDFSGRDLELFGVGEHVNLLLPENCELNKYEKKHLRWLCHNGSGYFYDNDHGNAVYVAGNKSETAILSLVNTSAKKELDLILEQEIKTIIPDDAQMVQQPKTHLFHKHGSFSVGFKGEIYLLPKVSYSELCFREGSAPGVGTGWFFDDTGDMHPIGQAHSITDNKVNATDTVSTGIKDAPYKEGTFDWPIPWEYTEKNGVREWQAFTIANHQEISDGTGKAFIQKKGAGPFTKNADALTTSYYE